MFNLLFSTVAISDAVVNALTNSLGFYYLLLFNLFGVLAMIFKVSEYQLKTRDRIIIFSTIASCCWFTYFVLQGDFTSAISNMLLIIQGLIFYQRGKHKWANGIGWLFVFLTAQAVFGIITFKTALDLFPIFGGSLCTLAYFVMKEKRYRIIMIFAMTLWLLNSITKGYVLATINDACCVASAIISLIRYSIIDKKGTQTEKAEEQNG